MSFLFTNPFDDIVEKATSENLPVGSEDLVLNLDIADKVKSKEVPPKDAVRSLKKRINHKNPNVQLLALKVRSVDLDIRRTTETPMETFQLMAEVAGGNGRRRIVSSGRPVYGGYQAMRLSRKGEEGLSEIADLTDTCVKNGGNHFLVEVASRDFIDNLVSIARAFGTNPDVKQKIFQLIQTWGLAFKAKSELSYVTEVYNSMKREGVSFPPVEKAEASSVMIDTTTAPDWIDAEVCMRCRTGFTMLNRKHHCRNCGQIFCHACSSNNIKLPHLGITQEVRVCDGCHTKLTTKSSNPTTPSLPRANTRADASGTTSLADAQARKEQEELEKAIAASLEESNKKSGKSNAPPARKPSTKKPVVVDDDEEDEDLKAAIAASLAELKLSEERQPRRDSNRVFERSDSNSQVYSEPTNPNQLSRVEIDNLKLFADLVERMEADVAARGPGVMNHSQISALYTQLFALQPKLMWSLDNAILQYKSSMDLNNKLSSALQQYDQLLQERLASSGAYGYQSTIPRSYSGHVEPYTVPQTSYYSQPPVANSMGYPQSFSPSNPANWGQNPAPSASGSQYANPAPPPTTQHGFQPQPPAPSTTDGQPSHYASSQQSYSQYQQQPAPPADQQQQPIQNQAYDPNNNNHNGGGPQQPNPQQPPAQQHPVQAAGQSYTYSHTNVAGSQQGGYAGYPTDPSQQNNTGYAAAPFPTAQGSGVPPSQAPYDGQHSYGHQVPYMPHHQPSQPQPQQQQQQAPQPPKEEPLLIEF
ncbi:Vacuolar protein-sorting-associated protein 27 [Chytridiales sp. JEL 0842]|nr:Vacuolar protein-sorting-associated protein 27 [Chytridiales sp. JEL 0842]